MAVAHSAASESHTGTTGSTNQTAFSWTHTQTGTPQGVLVFVHTISATDTVTSVTYGAVTLTRVSGGAAIDATTEPGRTDLFFAGSGLGAGNQTITVNRTNNATVMYASAATVTAATNTLAVGVQIQQDNQALAEVSVNDDNIGVNSVRYAATYYGGNLPAAAGANSTLLTSIDFGSFGCSMVRETTAGQGSRPVGFSDASDDVAAVYIAIRELANYSLVSAVGSFTLGGQNTALLRGFVVASSPAAYVVAGQDANFARGYSILIDAGGFSIAGQNGGFLRGYSLAGGAAAFALNGQDASSLRGYATAAEAGAFVVGGQNAASLAVMR